MVDEVNCSRSITLAAVLIHMLALLGNGRLETSVREPSSLDRFGAVMLVGSELI
jgi:hypothetical protein